MPWKPRARCRKCGEPASIGGLCKSCSDERFVRLRAEHPNSGRRGYDAAWRKLAKEAIALQPFCSVCGSPFDLTADHVDPNKRTNLTLADVQVLCRTHNTRKGG